MVRLRRKQTLKRMGGRLAQDVTALSHAVRDARTPAAAKVAAAIVVAYAASPIDLIPDFVPVLGQLDDVLVVGIGLWLVRKLIPPDVMADARAQAARAVPSR